MDRSLSDSRTAGILLKTLNESADPLSIHELTSICRVSLDELRLLLDTLKDCAPDVDVQGEEVRLLKHVDLIDESRLYQQVSGSGRVSVQTLLTSTNTVLAQYLENAVSGDVLAAEIQTAARGRRGRSWQGALGAQLTFSMCWRFADVNEALGLPLVCGLSVIDALHPLELPLAIKWPNDIYLDGGKLCGVLVELTHAKDQSGQWAVIGIGLNLQAGDSLRAEVGPRRIAALSDFVKELPYDRTELLSRNISVLRRNIALFVKQGLSPFLPLWEHYDFLKNKALSIELEDGREVSGISTGTDLKGRLLLRLHDGNLQPIASGHIISIDGVKQD